MEVDLNCDLGEGAGNDAEIMPLITSANIAGLFHSRLAETFNAVKLARQHGVVVGAHPGHDDREHFGRRELPTGALIAFGECFGQIAGLIATAKLEDVPVRYLKPHGGLYHQANREEEYAEAVVKAAEFFKLIVMGLPGSKLEQRSRGRCLFVAEGFADRRYRADGSLVPRDQPGAFVEDPEEAVLQVERLLRDQGVRTICVHGDNPKAVDFVKALRHSLIQKGHTLRPFA